jgi:methyltransferase (TIGR00027 family)
MLKQLKRIVYRVQDVEKARDWYTKLLGQEPVFDSRAASIFRIGNCSLSLSRAASISQEAGERMTVYWEVEDVDQSFDQLLTMGAQEKARPQNKLSIRTAQVLDPFGNILGLTGKIPGDESKTVENQASETAHSVALCRALASCDTRFDTRMPDPFSKLFLHKTVKPLLLTESSRNTLIDARISRPLYGYLIARSSFIDEIFSRALDHHLPQIVFLGAGYDTRTLRFHDRLGTTRIYELDIAATQHRKKDCLNASHTAIPEQLTFVEVNFKTDIFIEKLIEFGFDTLKPALYIWEGVTYYLPRDIVDKTFELIQTNSTTGTGICFDYSAIKLDAVNAGEPFLSWMDPAGIEQYLAQYNFRLVEHLDSAKMVSRYLTLKNGTAGEKPFAPLRLIYTER